MGNLFASALGFCVGIWLFITKERKLAFINLILALLNVWCWLWVDRE